MNQGRATDGDLGSRVVFAGGVRAGAAISRHLRIVSMQQCAPVVRNCRARWAARRRSPRGGRFVDRFMMGTRPRPSVAAVGVSMLGAWWVTCPASGLGLGLAAAGRIAPHLGTELRYASGAL